MTAGKGVHIKGAPVVVLGSSNTAVTGARHRVARCNVLTRGLCNGRWAASAWCRRRCRRRAAVRTFDRHGDARIGDGDAIRSVGIDRQHHFTECDRGGQIGLRRSCDGQFLRLAQAAGKAKARWLRRRS